MSTQSFVKQFCEKIVTASEDTLADVFDWALEYNEDKINPNHVEYLLMLKMNMGALAGLVAEDNMSYEHARLAVGLIIAIFGKLTGCNPPSDE
jgi:uncharacterized membrane protein